MTIYAVIRHEENEQDICHHIEAYFTTKEIAEKFLHNRLGDKITCEDKYFYDEWTVPYLPNVTYIIEPIIVSEGV